MNELRGTQPTGEGLRRRGCCDEAQVVLGGGIVVVVGALLPAFFASGGRGHGPRVLRRSLESLPSSLEKGAFGFVGGKPDGGFASRRGLRLAAEADEQNASDGVKLVVAVEPQMPSPNEACPGPAHVAPSEPAGGR